MNEHSVMKARRPFDGDPRQDATPSSQRAGTWPLLALGLWFVAQFCLFRQYLHREVLWAFPGHWDQVRFLQESHDVFRDMFTAGFPRGLLHALGSPTPTGNLLPAEAGVLYLFFGDSRLTALSILFLHWIVLQAAVVATIRWLSERWSLALVGLALLQLAGSPFRQEGGLADFRVDFAAYCTFGVVICLVIRSNVFANRRVGLLAAGAASYLVLLRFITLVYLMIIGGLFLLALALVWWLRRQHGAASGCAKRRMAGLLLVGGLTLTVCLPVFWHNRKAIQQYYVVGHATGKERHIRAQEFGVGSRLDSVLYYPRSVWMEHAGPHFRWAAGGLILLSLLAAATRWKAGNAACVLPSSKRLDTSMVYAFLSACLFGPYLILTTDVSKSPVVGGIFIPPLWAMIVLGVVCATGTHTSLPMARWLRYALTGLAALLFSVAFSYQVSCYNKPGRFTRQRADVERVLELHDLVGQKCQELGLQSPAIGVDRLSDAFFPGVLTITEWERHRVALTCRAAYPQGVFAANEVEVMTGLRSCDFALLTVSGATETPPYPFDQSMLAMQSKLFDFCDREMLPLCDTSFFGRHVRLYMRPLVRLETPHPYTDWITDDGMTLQGTTAVLRRFPRITLRGSTFSGFHFPDDDRNVTATLEMEDRPSLPVPATLSETNGQYTIHLTVPPLEASGDRPLSIRLRFHRYFVPRDLGLNDDTRRLVIRLPESLHLDRLNVN